MSYSFNDFTHILCNFHVVQCYSARISICSQTEIIQCLVKGDRILFSLIQKKFHCRYHQFSRELQPFYQKISELPYLFLGSSIFPIGLRLKRHGTFILGSRLPPFPQQRSQYKGSIISAIFGVHIVFHSQPPWFKKLVL